MFGHNRFEEQDKTKLGKLLKSTFNMPISMESDIENAIPIWDLLGLSVQDYNAKYKTDDIKEEVVEEKEGDIKEEIVEEKEDETIVETEVETEDEIVEETKEEDDE